MNYFRGTIFFNLLGDPHILNRAQTNITQILSNNGFLVKNVTLENTEDSWRAQIKKEISDVQTNVFKSDKVAVIVKCEASRIENDEFTELNRYIRNQSASLCRPCAFYVVDKEEASSLNSEGRGDYYFKKYEQINQIFDVDRALSEQENDLDIYFD